MAEITITQNSKAAQAATIQSAGEILISFVPIDGKDYGFACLLNDSDDMRVDIFKPGVDDEVPGPTISIQEPTLTPAKARAFAMLLLAAADFSERLEPWEPKP